MVRVLMFVVSFGTRAVRAICRRRADLVERFTRLDADTLAYEFTVNDPSVWTRPWTAAWPLTTLESALSVQHDSPVAQIFEYACHEGNYGMSNTLAGTRALDQAATRGLK